MDNTLLRDRGRRRFLLRRRRRFRLRRRRRRHTVNVLQNPRQERRDAREAVRLAVGARIAPRHRADQHAVADQRAAGVAVAHAARRLAGVHAQNGVVHQFLQLVVARPTVDVGQGGQIDELQLLGQRSRVLCERVTIESVQFRVEHVIAMLNAYLRTQDSEIDRTTNRPSVMTTWFMVRTFG